MSLCQVLGRVLGRDPHRHQAPHLPRSPAWLPGPTIPSKRGHVKFRRRGARYLRRQSGGLWVPVGYVTLYPDLKPPFLTVPVPAPSSILPCVDGVGGQTEVNSIIPEGSCWGEPCGTSPLAHIHILIQECIKHCSENFTIGLGPIWLFLPWRGGRGVCRNNER